MFRLSGLILKVGASSACKLFQIQAISSVCLIGCVRNNIVLFAVYEGHLKLRPLTVKVSGYNVSVEVVPAEDCFQVLHYDIFIFSETLSAKVTGVQISSQPVSVLRFQYLRELCSRT